MRGQSYHCIIMNQFYRRLLVLQQQQQQLSLKPTSLLSSSWTNTTTSKQSSTVAKSFTTNTTTTNKKSSSLPPIPKNCHRIVLMRHGESAFNNANIFTGWCDVSLTPRGVVEAIETGEVFHSHHIIFRKCYTSLLTRSIITAHRTLEAAGISYIPIIYDWKLNERHYGALQGLSKDRIAIQLGTKRVMKWRRSYDSKPPIMTQFHPHYNIIQNDIRYQHVKNLIPLTESLYDCQIRVIDVWNNIIKDIQHSFNRSTTEENKAFSSNHNHNHEQQQYLDSMPYTLIVAHANSLRALVMYLDNIPQDDIENLNIPTAIPFYYDIDIQTGKVIDHFSYKRKENIARKIKGIFRGIYISDDRKKYNFLERRRVANDPWSWALHDDHVSHSILTEETTDNDDSDSNDQHDDIVIHTMNEKVIKYDHSNDTTLEEDDDDFIFNDPHIFDEAKKNTEMFSDTATASPATNNTTTSKS